MADNQPIMSRQQMMIVVYPIKYQMLQLYIALNEGLSQMIINFHNMNTNEIEFIFHLRRHKQ